jgi:hypothetical protein
MPTFSLRIFILAAALAAVLAPPSAPARAAAADSALAESRWGVIPARADSNTVAFDNRARAAWEWPLFIPYAAINYPLRWVRHGVGAGIVWLDTHRIFERINIVPAPEGVVPALDYGSLSGVTFGINYYDLLGARRHPMRLRAEYSTERWQRYTGGVAFNRGGRFAGAVGAGYRLRPNLRYYGVGPQSRVEDEAFYEDERAWVGASARHALGRDGVVAVGVAYSSVGARAPDLDEGVSLAERLPGVEAPPGFGDRSHGVMSRLAIGWDTTREEGTPERGGIVGGSVGYFAPVGDADIAFLAYRFELQRFVRLWHTGRALALRGYVSWIETLEDEPFPFQRLFINDVPDDFRGYKHGRWRDRGITGVTAEYRFPFIADRRDGGFGIDTVLLADVGQVFPEFDAIRGDDLTVSYGFGWRAYMNQHYIGAMLFVWSEESFQFHLTTKQLFQFSKEVLFNGREELLIH